MEKIYSVGELCKKLNLNKETIRYYEKVGLLSKPKRDSNGYRIYTEKDIEMLNFILIIKQFGFSLKEIRTLIHNKILCGDIKSIKKIVENKINDVNTKMKELEGTKNLLEKVKKNILDNNLENCKDVEIYFKNKS